MVTRTPHDRSAPIRSRAPSEAQPNYVVWSWPGEFSAADLNGVAASPIWVPFKLGIFIIKIDFALGSGSWTTGPPIVRLFSNDGQIAVISGDGSWTQSVSVNSWATYYWVTAESDESPDSTIIGRDMSLIMWYRPTNLGAGA